MSSVSKRPWFYVPALYFLEGIPYIIVNSVAVVMFKKMGVPNGQLSFWTSLIGWPWMLKMFWGPMIDRVGTKRQWIVGCQLVMIFLLVILSLCVMSEASWLVALGILSVVAFISASHDIAADGFYMLSLSEKEQSFFVGIRSTAYRMAMIFGTGFLVYLGGFFESQGLSVSQTWAQALLVGVAVYTLGLLVGLLTLPKPKQDHSVIKPALGYEVFKEYFTQPRIAVILGFILFYRFGESMVSKMSSPFLMDPVSAGGLGLSTQDVGFIGGVVGVGALTMGGIVGGLTLSRRGLKKSLWPMILSMNIPNLFYLMASLWQLPKWTVYGIVGVDQFGYGFGFSAYMVYLMFLAQDSEEQSSHFAISTGLMALGALSAGAVSGYIEEWLGYSGFFVATIVLSVPGMLILRRLPLEKKDLFKVKVDLH